MHYPQLSFSRLHRLLASGVALLLAPMLLVSCGGDDLDIDALNAEALARQKAVRAADSVTITKYIADSSFTNVQRRPSGLYVVTKVAGTGATPQPGQNVSVLYKGLFLTQPTRIFDQSKPGPDGKLDPIKFSLGRGQVIPGWDEGIGLLRKGEKAILLIPSGQAYGPSGAGNVIPGNTPLRFDVELTDFN
ncbi:FKBP-type peptidyl-prolyl cis-trans isomerase [Hymenobacter tibetensis]|uniref:Peptidyl-prolyl cis-trans isomerase n=1 Tax=Hymenobacter tibetensis TaxID=497967 RepID=A0ABY4D481_9BACT|nr:FKBP-type peptidyl-prolyl cis-trans isomerase [Hymenobacter tibetensis]UOG77167.1 FKBP-type peptidyl-prolyl cis-trans isomerase [Hymenobacter tibetensis]